MRDGGFVVIDDGRITEVGQGNAPAGGTVIDLAGRVLMPGLIDAHLHYEDFAAELLLNHGVTSVLDLGNDYEWIKTQADGIRDGWIPGPRLYFSTPHFDASPPEGSPLLRQRGHKHQIVLQKMFSVFGGWEDAAPY